MVQDSADVYDLICEGVPQSVRECVLEDPRLARTHYWTVRATDNHGAWNSYDLWFQTMGSSSADYDLDGLSDYVEADWWPNKVAVFCEDGNDPDRHCALPDPERKDLYVEVDWMVEKNPPPCPGPGTCASEYSMKPTVEQTQPVVEAFARQGVRLVFDTGQLSGGNPIPDAQYRRGIYFINETANVVDFFDYKHGKSTLGITEHFDDSRFGVFRYLLMGHHYLERPMSGGVALGWDDDLFVSYGRIFENASQIKSPEFDRFISGIIMHELGHTLCLVHPDLAHGEPSECRYFAIDNDDEINGQPPSYRSVMNYLYSWEDDPIIPGSNPVRRAPPLDGPDYSHGPYNPGPMHDHDDWSAVRFDGFDTPHPNREPLHGPGTTGSGPLKNPIYETLRIPEFKVYG